jgi:hypothetical protein
MEVCITGYGSTVQTPPSPTATVTANPDPVLKDLEPRQIRASADSWEKLVAAVQPTFTWEGIYMLWVRDGTGTNEPRFEMDRAFGYQPDNGKVQWVLLATPVDESLYRELEGYRLRGMASVVAKEPAQRCDACGSGDWAMVLAPKSDQGTAYQIGWEGIMNGGSGHYLEEKLLYVLKDKNGQWRFMGEGESNGSGKNGALDCYQSFTVATEAVPNAQAPYGLEIHFTQELDDSECGQSYPGYAPRQPRVEYTDGVLDGRSIQAQRSRPYVKARADDTFENVVHHLATWGIGWDTEIPASPLNVEKHLKIEEWWRQELIRLNTGIKSGDIAAGTKILIPTYAETVN